jgi:hypothetical protein
MSGESEPGEEALALYRRLAAQTPNVVYRQRLGELQRIAELQPGRHRFETDG